MLINYIKRTTIWFLLKAPPLIRVLLNCQLILFMMFADDILLCEGKEVDMTEYLETCRTSPEEGGMRARRMKTQFLDFTVEQNEQGNGDHKAGGSRLDKLEEMQWTTVRQKDASETEGEGLQNSNQASNAMCGRNVGYNEETRKTDWGERDENDTMDVRSDTQRQDQERTHPRDNESGTGFQKDHGETIDLERACDEERWRTHEENGYTRKMKIGRPKTRRKDACQWDLKSTGLRVGEETDRAMWRRKISNHTLHDGKS